ncbi:MAG: lipoprotein-releasing system ATP-binding protein [Saprospiraceae bacterium]|jgi:lipoprotein-releasing system ATP-binding protein
MSAVLETKGLTRRFNDGVLDVDVIQDTHFTVNAGEQIAIVGASGSGKSTLLHLLGGLSKPTSGTVWVDGQEIAKLSAKKQGQLRNETLGFVYQFHHLLQEFTALENVAMPLLIRGVESENAMATAEDMLIKTGLAKRLEHKPGELSGGERQRAAVARALVTKPKCVLADEPTGNLDHQTAENIHALMVELNQELGTSLVVVTHDRSLAARLHKQYRLEEGQLALWAGENE